MKSYYSQAPGACLSCTIDKYVYVSLLVHPETDYSVRTMYEQTETVNDLNEIKHDIVREALKIYHIANSHGITISSMADIPASGTGLGSSSAFTVGLLNALSRIDNDRTGLAEDCNHRYHLAEEACKLEIDICGHPIGKQDQYAAALGGMNFIKFWNDETVDVSTTSGVQMNTYRLQQNLLLVYTGISRKADDILTQQNTNLENDQKSRNALRRNATRAHWAYQIMQTAGISLDEIGEMLHEAWQDKKSIVSSISNPKIDEIYETALKAGATGGKVIGAGGGGFMIFYCPRRYNRVWNKLTDSGVKLYPFKFVDHGSRVMEV